MIENTQNISRPTLSQKISKDLKSQYREIAAGFARNGYEGVSAHDIQEWDEAGQVPEHFLHPFAQALDLSKPEWERLNLTPVMDKGWCFKEYHQSFYQEGWFIYIWNDAIGVYQTDGIERCKEDADLMIKRTCSELDLTHRC